MYAPFGQGSLLLMALFLLHILTVVHLTCHVSAWAWKDIPSQRDEISTMLTQKEQLRYHLHASEFRINVNERKSMQLLAGNEHEVPLAGPRGRNKQQIVPLPLKTSSKHH